MPEAIFDRAVMAAPDQSYDTGSVGVGSDFMRIAIPAPLFGRWSAMTTGSVSVTAACGRLPALVESRARRGTTVTQEA